MGRSVGEHLALDDPKVNCLPVKPGGVNRYVHQEEVGILLLQPVDRLLAPMG